MRQITMWAMRVICRTAVEMIDISAHKPCHILPPESNFLSQIV
jgi:hypothetical protein